MADNTLDGAVVELARVGLAGVDVKSVQEIALWCWRGSGEVNLAGLRGMYREDLFLLLQRLSGFTAVAPERKVELLNLVKREAPPAVIDNRSFQLRYRQVLPMLQALHAELAQA